MHHVVALSGGLGNQLFQYGFGMWLEEVGGVPVAYDVSAFRNSHRSLALDRLGLELPGSTEWRFRALPDPKGRIGPISRLVRVTVGPRRFFYEGVGDPEKRAAQSSWWFGYWQSQRFAVPVVRKLRSSLSLREPNSNVVGVHVRRTDYIGNEHELLVPQYRRILDAALSGAPGRSVVVVSDDPEWCRSHLDLGHDVEVRVGASAVEDLLFLAECERLVLSRSTFSWWAANLAERPEGTVFVADPFFPSDPAKEQDLISPGWVRVPVDEPLSS